jgi:hypothetical protein
MTIVEGNEIDSETKIPGPDYVSDDSSEKDDETESVIEKHREQRKKNKLFLFEWLVEADFSKEINLVQLAEHPFRLDPLEEELYNEMSFGKIMKILKL